MGTVQSKKLYPSDSDYQKYIYLLNKRVQVDEYMYLRQRIHQPYDTDKPLWDIVHKYPNEYIVPDNDIKIPLKSKIQVNDLYWYTTLSFDDRVNHIDPIVEIILPGDNVPVFNEYRISAYEVMSTNII